MDLQEELQRKLMELTDLRDFKLTLEKRYDPDNFGEYFLKTKECKLYILDDQGNEYPREVIECEAIHELAHHMQYQHTKGYRVTLKTIHGYVWRRRFANLLQKYYNNDVPQSTVNNLIERGYINESQFTKIWMET